MNDAPLGFLTRPHNIDAEQAVLGAILVNNDAWRAVASYLRPEHFYEPVHGRIFAAISRLIEAGRVADHVTLKVAFDEDPDLRDLDGSQYLARIARAAETILNAQDYARHIVDLAVRRGLISSCETATNAAYDTSQGAAINGELVHLRGNLDILEREATSTNGDTLRDLCLSPAEWEARDIEPEDTLLGPFSTTTRIELSADTGLGKTMLGLALAHAKAIGQDFLHWKAVRPARVLFVDGEMPQGLIKARLKVARSWFDLAEPLGRDRLCVLSREDVPDMPPLDTSEGARFVLNAFDQLGRFDHVTLDNRACLAVGDLSGEDASTTALKTLQRKITKLRTGQLWLHHTGHDGSRGYGRKAREWELDTVMVGERLEARPELDVGMRLTFPKARRRTPDNRADYEPVEIDLRQGQWSWQQTEAAKIPTSKLGRNQRVVYDAATKLLAASDTKAPPGHVAGNRTVIRIESLEAETKRSMACDQRHFASRFNEALNGLANCRRLGHYDGVVWAP